MVGTVEDFVARKQADRDDEGLSQFDRDLIGAEWVRLEVPVHSAAKLRYWADLMRGLLNTIDFYTQPRLPGTPEISTRARLLHIRMEASDINRRVRAKNPPGRPKKDGG